MLSPEALNFDVCRYVVQKHGRIALQGCSLQGGPYIITVDDAVIHVFGCNELYEPLSGVDVPGSPIQLDALEAAASAMRTAIANTDPGDDSTTMQEIVRKACKHSHRNNETDEEVRLFRD